MSRKPFAVIFALEEHLSELSIASCAEWNVERVHDPDRLFELIVNPRCFAVILGELGRIPPLLLVERGRQVTNSHWHLLLGKGSKISINDAREKGALVTSAPFQTAAVLRSIWFSFGVLVDSNAKHVAWKFGPDTNSFCEGRGGFLEMEGGLQKWMDEVSLRTSCDGWAVWSCNATDNFKLLKVSSAPMKDVARDLYPVSMRALKQLHDVVWDIRTVRGLGAHAVMSLDGDPKAAHKFYLFLHFAQKPSKHVEGLLKQLPPHLKKIEKGLLKLRYISDLLSN